MRNHTQSYFDLNPKPTLWALLRTGFVYAASVLWAFALVYGLAVLVFSF